MPKQFLISIDDRTLDNALLALWVLARPETVGLYSDKGQSELSDLSRREFRNAYDALYEASHGHE